MNLGALIDSIWAIIYTPNVRVCYVSPLWEKHGCSQFTHPSVMRIDRLSMGSTLFCPVVTIIYHDLFIQKQWEWVECQ